MSGTSKKTKVVAIRATPLTSACIEAVAEKFGCSKSDAQRRMIRAGALELLGAMTVKKIRDGLPAESVSDPAGFTKYENEEQTSGQ
jgi:hypothetical protein